MKYLTKLLFIFLILSSKFSFASNQQSCEVSDNHSVLRGGYYEWKPYQYNQNLGFKQELIGLDTELPNYIMKELGVEISYEVVFWDQHLQDLRSGKRDIAPGAGFSRERSEYVHYSDSYRFEEISLFVSRVSLQKLNFSSMEEFVTQVKASGFKLGIMDGMIYGDDILNNFVHDVNNADVIVKSLEDTDNIKKVISGELDGFLSDKLAGASLILDKNLGSKIVEIPLGIKSPIYMIFSKKTVSPEFVQRVNLAIKKLKSSEKYNEILSKYVFPVVLLQIMSSTWFMYVSYIGAVAFVLSGLNISLKDNNTLFVTLILSIVPPIPLSLCLDIIQSNSDFHITRQTIILSTAIVLIGFSALRALDAFNKESRTDKTVQEFFRHFLNITDSIGHSCFSITGVAIAILLKYTPILIWGPIFAFLLGNGGTIIRDLLTKTKDIRVFNGDLNPEISLLWGFGFSFYLESNATNPDSYITSLVAILFVIAGVVTRIITIYKNLPNLKFR